MMGYRENVQVNLKQNVINFFKENIDNRNKDHDEAVIMDSN